MHLHFFSLEQTKTNKNTSQLRAHMVFATPQSSAHNIRSTRLLAACALYIWALALDKSAYQFKQQAVIRYVTPHWSHLTVSKLEVHMINALPRHICHTLNISIWNYLLHLITFTEGGGPNKKKSDLGSHHCFTRENRYYTDSNRMCIRRILALLL